MSPIRGTLAALSSEGWANVPWSPVRLFQNGEQGMWYDPNDFSTLYQDADGATAVTAVEQPVSLMIDKRLGGGAIGSNTVTNGTFASDTSWTKGTGWTIGSGVATKTAGTASLLSQSATFTTGRTYLITYTITRTAGSITPQFTGGTTVDGTARSAAGTYTDVMVAVSGNTTLAFSANSTFAGTIDNVTMKELPAGNHAYTPSTASASRPVVSARVNLLSATTTLSTQTVAVVAVAHTLRFTGAGSITLSGTATGTYSAGSHSISPTAGNLTLTVSGTVTDADLRQTSDGVGFPVYQRVTNSTDYDTVGFPMYLKADGSDDYMRTVTLDFSGTDKNTAVVGVRKLSDAAAGVYLELSADINSNNGTFIVLSPATAAANYAYWSKGTTLRQAGSGANAIYAAPNSRVIGGTSNISGDSVILRLDGTVITTTTTDQGTGNYGNYPMFFFRRNGSTLPFNGRCYGIVVRGAETDAASLETTERFVNQKSRIY